jgi:DNA helicase-2/ATP-dependent DNA helicase PcrA
MRTSRTAAYDLKATQWESKKPSAAKVSVQKFKPGTHVQHPVWGDGMVLTSRLQDDDEIVDIFFENIGMKRVAASLANLKTKG